jgi:deoxyribose-phosphate aldolase
MISQPKNQGLPLDLHWVKHCAMGDAEVAARVAKYEKDQPAEPADLRKLLGFVDLTTLNGGDTTHTVHALCTRAKDVAGEKVAGACVYPVFLPILAEHLAGTGIAVVSATGGFPHGLSPLSSRIDEVRESVKMGATEVDIVIRRSHALAGDWRLLYDEVRALRDAAGPAVLKTILATGELRTLECIYRSAIVCMMAGTDFVKTSTGKETVNATLPAGFAMACAIREFHERTGFEVGLKPAGGIQKVEQALQWAALVQGELGPHWFQPELFRIGASKLVDDIESRLAG